jgi:hypothetical protein
MSLEKLVEVHVFLAFLNFMFENIFLFFVSFLFEIIFYLFVYFYFDIFLDFIIKLVWCC